MPRLLFLLPLLLLGGTPVPAVPSQDAAVIVSEVPVGSAGATAGLHPGDVLCRWQRRASAVSAEASGTLRSPFDWTQVSIEQIPRGDVVLYGYRGELPRTWTLPGGGPSAWRPVQVQPRLPAPPQDRVEIEAWLSLHQARAELADGRTQAAGAIFQGVAASLAAVPGRAPFAAQVQREWGDALLDRRQWQGAANCFRRALQLDRSSGDETLAAAWSLSGLGTTANWSGGAADPERYFRAALGIRQRLAPGSSDVAESFCDRGKDAQSSHEYRTACRRFSRSVSLLENRDSGGLFLAEKVLNLAAAEYFAEDLDGAAAHWRRSLAIAERAAPADIVVAGSWQGLADVAMLREDWPHAESSLLRARDVLERGAGGPLEVAYLLSDLASTERRLGKLRESTAALCRGMELADHELAEVGNAE
ncbi:MAG TPA: hypothetical protein VGE98_02370, partial [Thermoanaerobaculia bacterium]